MINDETVEQMYSYTLNDGLMSITATKTMEFIYAEGIPLQEPIAWHGPIVMNTKEEIKETLKDLNNGTFL
jgi:redox-sensitive bicupin YhaK (pirin superfamily)